MHLFKEHVIFRVSARVQSAQIPVYCLNLEGLKNDKGQVQLRRHNPNCRHIRN